MKGKHLLISVSSIAPFLDYIRENGTIILKGVFGEFWKLVEERLDLNSDKVIETYDELIQNNWQTRRDVLLHPLVIFSEDLDDFYSAFPIASAWYQIYLKESDDVYSSSSYVRNWSTELWISTIFMIMLFATFLFLTLKVSRKFLRKEPTIGWKIQSFKNSSNHGSNEIEIYPPTNWRRMTKCSNEKRKDKRDGSLGCCLMAVVAAFASQDISLETSVTSARILIFSFLIYGMIMYNAYSALLVSQLTLHERPLPFEHLEEIPEKAPDFSLCIRRESYPFDHFMENVTVKLAKEKWRKILNKRPCPENKKVNSKHLCASHVAFLESPSIMKLHLLNNKKCKITKLSKKYFNINISLLFKKELGKNFERQINMEVIKYKERGILTHMMRKDEREDEPLKDIEKIQVSFHHTEGVFLVYFICLGFSCIIYMAEVLMSKKSKSEHNWFSA